MEIEGRNPEAQEPGEQAPEEPEPDAAEAPEGAAPEDATPLTDNTEDEHAETAGAVPPVPPPVPARRFVRDPYARFGGVASGLAHYFGWDVALTRLGVVLLFIVSGGTAIVAYLLAWLIIPRATHWPPSGGPTAASRLSSRDIGIGLAVLGALLALAIAGGRPGAVLIPLALIGGGVWLLSQNPTGAPSGAPPAASPPSPPAAPPLSPSDVAPEAHAGSAERAATSSTMTATAVAAPPAPPPSPPPAYDPGPPVPPRSRAGRWIVRLIIGFFVLLVLALLAIPITLFFLARSGNLDFDPDERVVVRPAAVSELPDLITRDAAEVVLDLRDLEPGDFAGEDTPVEVEVDLNAGEVRVRVSDDLRVSVDASVGIGDVDVFGSSSDGFFPDQRIDIDDAHLDLELDVGVGAITVQRN